MAGLAGKENAPGHKSAGTARARAQARRGRALVSDQVLLGAVREGGGEAAHARGRGGAGGSRRDDVSAAAGG